MPTCNTTWEHKTVQSRDFGQSFCGPSGWGLWSPLKPRCSPSLPLCFEIQECRNSLDPQTPLASRLPKPSHILIPLLGTLSHDLFLWSTLTPLGLFGRGQFPQKAFLDLPHPAEVSVLCSSLAPYPFPITILLSVLLLLSILLPGIPTQT